MNGQRLLIFLLAFGLGSSFVSIYRLDNRVDDMGVREVTANARADTLAERVVILTDRWNESAELLDRLSAACVADGGCVASDETGDNDG